MIIIIMQCVIFLCLQMFEKIKYIINYFGSGKTHVSSTKANPKLTKNDLALLYQQTDDDFAPVNHTLLSELIIDQIDPNQSFWYSHRRSFKKNTIIILFESQNIMLNVKIIEMISSLMHSDGLKNIMDIVPNINRHYSITLPVQLMNSKSYISSQQLEYDFLKCSINITKYPIKHKFNDHYVILSVQQSNILLALSKGEDYKSISAQCSITPKTIEHYLNIIKAKTGYRSKLELVCAFRTTNMWI